MILASEVIAMLSNLIKRQFKFIVYYELMTDEFYSLVRLLLSIQQNLSENEFSSLD